MAGEYRLLLESSSAHLSALHPAASYADTGRMRMQLRKCLHPLSIEYSACPFCSPIRLHGNLPCRYPGVVYSDRRSPDQGMPGDIVLPVAGGVDPVPPARPPPPITARIPPGSHGAG